MVMVGLASEVNCQRQGARVPAAAFGRANAPRARACAWVALARRPAAAAAAAPQSWASLGLDEGPETKTSDAILCLMCWTMRFGHLAGLRLRRRCEYM